MHRLRETGLLAIASAPRRLRIATVGAAAAAFQLPLAAASLQPFGGLELLLNYEEFGFLLFDVQTPPLSIYHSEPKQV